VILLPLIGSGHYSGESLVRISEVPDRLELKDSRCDLRDPPAPFSRAMWAENYASRALSRRRCGEAHGCTASIMATIQKVPTTTTKRART
jgi:hypothetical protein